MFVESVSCIVRRNYINKQLDVPDLKLTLVYLETNLTGLYPKTHICLEEFTKIQVLLILANLRWWYSGINNIHSFFYIISISFLVLILSFDYYIISMVFNFDKKFKAIALINQELLE